ncbi:hypothetical protein K488DRAFT_86587 [Vararia minispora EC-137]|uniref:Uncharacterized protein n=1 Tax=Vararia minispora EC-137 TaxID=1314806 RepID=A0ACB8QJ55_9AGAM|nr:hypothetical protein K488DRAFT_86587 [Vararia minispora EC-137]
MSKQPLAPGSFTPLTNGFLPRRRNFRVTPTPLVCSSVVERLAPPHHDVTLTTQQSASSPRRSTTVTSYPVRLPRNTAEPLRSSLKPTASSPSLPSYCEPPRANPEPLATRKSVQFKETELESVRLYRPTGRPAHLLSSAATSDTETETESDASHLSDRPAPSSFDYLDVDYARSSPLCWSPSPDSHVLLESLSLPSTYNPSGTPMLHGTALVRNISYEKNVSVRFTLDSWDTVSEVRAEFDGPVGDAVTGPYALHGPWDRFRFVISVPLNAHARMMLLAGIFSPELLIISTAKRARPSDERFHLDLRRGFWASSNADIEGMES